MQCRAFKERNGIILFLRHIAWWLYGTQFIKLGGKRWRMSAVVFQTSGYNDEPYKDIGNEMGRNRLIQDLFWREK